MKFKALKKETIILDPAKNMEQKSIPSEIRKDPLTGRSARICYFMELKWKKPDLKSLLQEQKNIVPFVRIK